MDIVERILAVAKVIYGQYQHMKYCKKQNERLIKRMEILLRPIELLQAQSLSTLSFNLKWMLQNMLDLLLEAQELFEKYKNHNMLERFMKAGDMLEEFANLNERFGDMGQGLLLQLQVEQKVLVSFKKYVVSKERCQDLAEDKVCWKEMAKGQQEEAHTEITEINKHFLTKLTFLLNMKDHILYKGEYYKSPVAVKVFKNPLTINIKKVRQIFEEEIRTLKRLDSFYIVRLYGICIDESGMIPQFSIVTEYCEKGTLREVLGKEQDLPWKIRRDMASDAVAGLYRLHQTGDKCQLHRCINSSKFLVAKGYCVKLSGFKLDQTELSISRKSKDKVLREVSSLAYICPEGLASLHQPYNLASEIYSFGIVLWEIATGKIPFTDALENKSISSSTVPQILEDNYHVSPNPSLKSGLFLVNTPEKFLNLDNFKIGCNSQQIYDKVYKEKVQEPLGEDCPSYLQTIINQCRSYNPSKRPTTEVIVNQLLIDQDDNSSNLTS